jgi:DNA-binding MarR family transcriptional regulator
MSRASGTRSAREGAGEPLGATLELMSKLWAVHHAMQSRSKHMEAEIGVTGPQRLALRFVGRRPGITAGDLAELLHLHPSTLTGILRRLEAAKLVERKRDPADARRARFHLTRGGRALDGERSGTVEAAVRRVLGRLSPAQASAARSALDQLAAELAND